MRPPAPRFRRACVTGGAGFIGAPLVQHLLDRGIEVTVLDDLSTGRRCRVPGGARFVEGSILDPAKTAEAFEGAEVLLHLAARVAIRSSFDFVVEDADTNFTGTAAVLRGASAAKTIRRVISTSSMAVYSDSADGDAVRESHPKEPFSPYGVSKLAAEELTRVYCSHAGMESIILRLFNTFGPGQTFSPYVGVVTIFVNQLRRGEQATIFGTGTQTRDFVHVQDVIQGFGVALNSSASREIYNVGTGVGTTVNELYHAIANVMGSKLPPQYAPAAKGELQCSVADISKISALGFRATRDLEGTLAGVIEEICFNST